MINNVPQIKFVYDRRKKATALKPAPLEMRISHNYKQKYISTGIMLYPHQWNNGMIVNCPDALELSKTLDKLLSDVRQVLLEMLGSNNVDISAIPERIKKLHTKQVTFIEYCNQRAEIRKYGKTKDSQERYNRFLRLFSKWGKITRFEDITEPNIISYDKYLISTGMQVYSKWNNYHRFLNSFIADAIDEGYLSKNPYKWVNIERGKNNKSISRHLSPEEFQRLKTRKMPTECIERVRDTFVFQTYTCLSYSDLSSFNADNIKTIKDTMVYCGKRHKTKGSFTIPLLKPAIQILDKYNGRLPVISNVKYNEYLKVAAQAAGIDKPVSSHWARHTGATLLLNAGVDMRIVAKICGHSSTRITEQVYAELLNETVVKAVSDVTL